MCKNKTPKPSREVVKREGRLSGLQIVGLVLLSLGLLTIILIGVSIAFASFDATKPPSDPTWLPVEKQSILLALSFFIIMLSMVFVFPDFLRGPNGDLSAMRIVVIMVVLVFVTLSIKAGWGSTSLDRLIVTSGWVSVLGVALGGKAFQSIFESGFFNQQVGQTGIGSPTMSFPNAANQVPNTTFPGGPASQIQNPTMQQMVPLIQQGGPTQPPPLIAAALVTQKKAKTTAKKN